MITVLPCQSRCPICSSEFSVLPKEDPFAQSDRLRTLPVSIINHTAIQETQGYVFKSIYSGELVPRLEPARERASPIMRRSKQVLARSIAPGSCVIYGLHAPY